MTRRILVAVDDSPAALAAARLTISLAHDRQAYLCAVTIVTDHAIADRLHAELADDPTDGLGRRRGTAASAVLHYVESLAKQASVPAQTVCLNGEPAARVLEQARTWGADLIVLGRSDL
jgi:nucleotide-binding universal stress UspA family protein